MFEITFGMALDGARWTEGAASIGKMKCGPLGMLKFLETRYALGGVEAFEFKRIDAYVQLDSAGNAVGEPAAMPYCPERFLTLVSIKDGEGCEFQIGTDAIDICAKLPPNTGSGLSIGRGRPFFDEGNGRTFEFREDALSSMRWESEPFEIDGNFRPCDISLNFWTVPDADGSTRCFIDCNSFEYRHCPLKMNVVDHGYKAVADKVWRKDAKP